MKSNKMQKLAMMYGLAAVMSDNVYGDAVNELTEDGIKPKKIKPKQVKKIIPKGLKDFFYGANSLYALNQKNADRKALKQGLIIADVSKNEVSF
jgi:hypothetical protein